MKQHYCDYCQCTAALVKVFPTGNQLCVACQSELKIELKRQLDKEQGGGMCDDANCESCKPESA